MNARLSAMHRVLDRPLSVPARALVLAAVVALLVGGMLPLWRIRLVAPQYAEGSRWTCTPTNRRRERRPGPPEINTLNHYIGMKPIAQADFLEMKLLPFAIGAFALFGLRAAAVGRVMSLVDLAVTFLYFGAFSLGSFAYRLYTYGHQLDPRAPMKIDPFMPVVVGSQQIANFVQTSLPLAGTACMGLFLACLLAALWTSARESRREAV